LIPKEEIKEINDYVELADRTNLIGESLSRAMARLQDPDVFHVEHGLQGLTTELGELMDIQKRHVMYGKDIDWDHVVEELGDTMWYLALICRVAQKKTGKDPARMLAININKLNTRYPDKFTEHAALNRDLTAERQIITS